MNDEELDRRTAKAVLGWDDWRPDPPMGFCVKPPGENSRRFQPSLYIEDAWILVDAVLRRVRGMFRLVRHGATARICTAVFYFKHNNEEYEQGSAVETTEPLAICKAALAAMERCHEADPRETNHT